jgi:hypothetical protein
MRPVRWIAAAGIAAVIALPLSALLFWPLQTSTRAVATVEPATVPAIVLSAFDRSYGGGWRPFVGAARLLQGPGHLHTLGRQRLEASVLSLRLRIFAGRERTLAYLAKASHYGGGASGLEEAARQVFCREVRKLDIGETVALVALTTAPGLLRRDDAAWRAARDRLLTAMERAGDIPAADAETARLRPLAPCAAAPTP